jgi:hypothetical protein
VDPPTRNCFHVLVRGARDDVDGAIRDDEPHPMTGGRPGSAATVSVGSVLDPDDVDDVTLLVQAVDDPIGAAPRREVAGQLTSERLAYPARVHTQWAAAELPYGKGDGEGQ